MGVKLNELQKELTAKNLRYVGTRGSTKAPICFVGESPGADEDRAGIPFCGESGRLADRMLEKAGFSIGDVWFTNPYQTRPPNNEIDRLSELGIDLRVYEDAFFEQLEEEKPTFIIAAGATPLSLLCPETRSRKSGEFGVGKWRGSLLTSKRLTWPHYVMPIYHPAFILRDWSEHDINVFILKKVKDEFDYWRANNKIQPLPERELIVTPTADMCIEYLQACLVQRERVSVDIELLKRKLVDVIGFARSSTSAICVPLYSFGDAASVRIFRLIDDILSKHAQIGQNYTSFDLHWLYHLGFNVSAHLVSDTRIRHSFLWPELPHKLEFMVMQYTREPYYKDEGRAWQPKDGQAVLQRYNCKDTTCTYEVHDRQEEEFDERPELKKFYLDQGQKLAGHMFNVERRGVATDPKRLKDLGDYIDQESTASCGRIAALVGKPVAVSAEDTKRLGPDAVCINSPTQVLALLKSRGLKVPKARYTGKESTGEEQLNQLFAESGDKVLKEILDVREFSKIKGTYVSCRTIDNILYSVYIVGGTVGGRRASRANPLGFGTNHQNQPKHSKLGKRFRSCLVARPGKIFVQCDQVSAEDWIINGIIADVSGDRRGLDELLSGVDRHQRLAAFIFGKPLEECSREAPTIYRYVGKRTRYAGSYGMGPDKFAAVLAKEGFSIPKEHCAFMLQKLHEYDPGIKGVFQAYVERELTERRTLRDLFGRERQFFGLHPHRDNSKIFREAYSYIPQSTVGDNTGAALNWCEHNFPGYIIMETHDALVAEVPDTPEDVWFGTQLLKRSFDRVLTFPNGLTLKIPIDTEIGYNLNDLVRCDNSSQAGLMLTYNTLVRPQSHQNPSTSGQQPVVLVQP